jgi:hypothetical protein
VFVLTGSQTGLDKFVQAFTTTGWPLAKAMWNPN